jgi:AcrR family transcriptional regulator
VSAAKAPELEPYRYFADFIEGRRGEILDAALAVFGEKGYEAGTMREIAKRVGVSEPAIYRHYESKEAILADIVATAGDRITSGVGEMLRSVNAENVHDKLYELLELRRRGFAKGRMARLAVASDQNGTVMAVAEQSGAAGIMHILFHAAPHNRHFVTLMREHLSGPMLQHIRELIPRVDAGFGIERSAEEFEGKLRIFISLFMGYFTTSLFFGAPPNDDAIVEAMLAIMGWEASGQSS